MKWGIDVSRWQGSFNFEKAKAEGVTFAILKAGGGDAGLYKDSKFDRNYSECTTLGIPCGAYFFGQAMDVPTALKEAEYFLSLIKGHNLPMGVWYDVEAKMLNASGLSTIVLAFVQRVNAAGYNCGVYSNEWVFTGKLKSGYDSVPKWIAKWTKAKPAVPCQIWQFGGETNLIRSNKVAGQVCDQNYLMDDAIPVPDVKPAPAPAKKTNEELAKEVLEGKWGNGIDRRSRLTAAGYNYSAVQSIVNRLVAEQNKKTDPAPSPAPTDPQIYYTVKKGDTMTSIAKKHETTLAALKKLNPQIGNVNLIYPGQKVRIK